MSPARATVAASSTLTHLPGQQRTATIAMLTDLARTRHRPGPWTRAHRQIRMRIPRLHTLDTLRIFVIRKRSVRVPTKPTGMRRAPRCGWSQTQSPENPAMVSMPIRSGCR